MTPNVDDLKLRCLNRIVSWLTIIWLTIIVAIFVAPSWFVGIEREVKELHITFDSRCQQVERTIKIEKEKIYEILSEMKDFEEKTLIIKRERGQYRITILEEGENEDSNKEKKADK